MTPEQKLAVYRSIDKLDRLGETAVKELLTTGRRDKSGDFTAGAGLSAAQADIILHVITLGKKSQSGEETLAKLAAAMFTLTMPQTAFDQLYDRTKKCGLLNEEAALDASLSNLEEQRGADDRRRLTLKGFLEAPLTGEMVAGRHVRLDEVWGAGVWWSDRFGICSPLVASTGGPLGHEGDKPSAAAESAP